MQKIKRLLDFFLSRCALKWLAKEFVIISQIKKWFSGIYKSYNERSILTADGKKYRPDKILTHANKAIVIDYKFGEQVVYSHEKQLMTYMQLLKEMHFTDINGYIYYGQTNTLQSYSIT